MWPAAEFSVARGSIQEKARISSNLSQQVLMVSVTKPILSSISIGSHGPPLNTALPKWLPSQINCQHRRINKPRGFKYCVRRSLDKRSLIAAH